MDESNSSSVEAIRLRVADITAEVSIFFKMDGEKPRMCRYGVIKYYLLFLAEWWWQSQRVEGE